MTQIRENVARRRAEGAYQEDVDAIADEVFAEVMAAGDAGDSAAPVWTHLGRVKHSLDRSRSPFRVRSSVLGKLIVALRNFWNWMSTKWYVRGLLQQQVEFNALVVRPLIRCGLRIRCWPRRSSSSAPN